MTTTLNSNSVQTPPPLPSLSSTSSMPPQPTNPLLIVEYNMLEQSLASPSIPWILTLPSSILKRIDAHILVHPYTYNSNSEEEVINSYKTLHVHISKIYHKHWHRNKNVSNYKGLRKLFGCDLKVYMEGGARCLTDVDGLDGVVVDCRDYIVVEGGGRIPTLQAIFKYVLGDGELSNDAFDAIQYQQKFVYDWQVRGPRIFKLITNNFGFGFDDNDDDNDSASTTTTNKNTYFPKNIKVHPSPEKINVEGYGDVELGPALPDVIVLLEYDVHGFATGVITPQSISNNNNDNNNDDEENDNDTCDPTSSSSTSSASKSEPESSYNNPPTLPYLSTLPSTPSPEHISFSTAMNRLGYHALLFEAPGEMNSGVGVFVRAGKFDIDFDDADEHNEHNFESVKPRNMKIKSSPLNSDLTYKSGGLVSVDLMDTCPPTSSSILGKLFTKGDRKTCGVCPLIFKQSSATDNNEKKKRLLLLPTHLMTSSRDSTGYIRSNEIQTIKRIASKYVREGDAVCFLGDFNVNFRPKTKTNANAKDKSEEGGCVVDEGFIFEGCIGGVDGVFDTGYIPSSSSSDTNVIDEDAKSKFKWSRSPTKSTSSSPSSSLTPKPLNLHDAYESYNKLGFDHEKQMIIGTSRNAMRVDMIDFVFFDADFLSVKWRSDILLKGSEKKEGGCSSGDDGEEGGGCEGGREEDVNMPNVNEPSDHIPLVVLFDVK